MATLREAIPEYKTNGIFKNIPGISSWGMSPELLDITLMGKYGNKTINSLMKEFTNNQGVVQDMSGLTNLVWQFHQDNWMKLYDAMRQDYNPIKPYSKDIESSQTVDNDISKQSQSTTTNNLQKRNTGTVGESGTITDDLDTTKTSTLSGSDTEEKTGTDTVRDTYDSTIADVSKIDSHVSKTINGDVVVEKEGSEDKHIHSADNQGDPLNYTEVWSDNNRTLPDGSTAGENDIKGISHNITKDKTGTVQANTNEVVSASNPYDENTTLGDIEITSTTIQMPGTTEKKIPEANETTSDTNFKPTDKQQSANNQATQSEHEFEEKTINQDFSHSKTADVKNVYETTTYGGTDPRTDTTTYNNYTEDVHTQTFRTEGGQRVYDQIDHEKTGSDTEATTYDSSVTTSYGKVDTIAETGDNTRTIDNTRTDDLTEALTGTVGVLAGDTVANDTTIESESSAVGNLGFMTSQRQLEEEIKLRQKYFYDGVVKDVASLLTVGTYA